MSTSKPLTSTSRSFWPMPDEGAADRDLRPVGEGAADRDQVAVVGALGVGHEAYGGAPLGREQRRVHVGHLVLDDVGEDALERRQLEHLDVELRDLAAHLDVDLLGDLAGQRGEDPAEPLGERDARAHLLGDHAALHVDRVGHQLAGEREPHRAGDRDARPSPAPRRSRHRGAGWPRRSRARTAGCRCTAPWRTRRGRRRRCGPVLSAS